MPRYWFIKGVTDDLQNIILTVKSEINTDGKFLPAILLHLQHVKGNIM